MSNNCARSCVPISQYDPEIHTLIGVYDTEQECSAACACGSSDSSATSSDNSCGFIECGGNAGVHADCGLTGKVIDCDICECVDPSSSSGESSGESSDSSVDSSSGSDVCATAEQDWIDYQLAQTSGGYTYGHISECGSPPGPTPGQPLSTSANTVPNGYLKLGGGASYATDNERYIQYNIGYETTCGVPVTLFFQMMGGGVCAKGFVYNCGTSEGTFYNVQCTYATRAVGSTGAWTENSVSLPYVTSRSTIYFDNDHAQFELAYVKLTSNSLAPPPLNTTDPPKLFLGLTYLRPVF